jgi:hypothetical protein
MIHFPAENEISHFVKKLYGRVLVSEQLNPSGV